MHFLIFKKSKLLSAILKKKSTQLNNSYFNKSIFHRGISKMNYQKNHIEWIISRNTTYKINRVLIKKKKGGKLFSTRKKLANTFPLEPRYQSLVKYPHPNKSSTGFSSTLQPDRNESSQQRSTVRSRDRCATPQEGLFTSAILWPRSRQT